MPGVSCTQCGDRFYWTEHYGEQICPKCKLAARPAFHVRFIESGVEQEQIFVGVPDGRGGFDIHVPTPCTLLSVKQHGFPYCEVCDGGPIRTLGVEGKPASAFNSYVSPEDCEDFLNNPPALPESVRRACAIRAEVEAMDWPEVIGE